MADRCASNNHRPPVDNPARPPGVTRPAASQDGSHDAAREGPEVDGGDTSAGHDPGGLEVAFQVAAHLGTGLPAPRTGPRRRPRPQREAGTLEAVGGVLDSFVDDRGWTTRVGLHQLLASWPALVGTDNAAHSAPESYTDGILTVRAESTTWAAALRFVAPQVVAALNDRLGDGSVTRIVVLGPTAPSWKHGPRSVAGGRGPRDTYG